MAKQKISMNIARKTSKYLLISLVLFFGLFGFAGRSQAATYYVDPSGSDSNPGTEALPWKTMIYGCTQVAAGDTLLVKNGTYAIADHETWYIPGLRIVNSGTETNPIIIKAYPGHKPIIDGLTGNHKFGTHQAMHIIIDGFIVRDGVIYINESSHITIQNCELVYGFNKPGDPSYTNMIEIRFSNFVTVRNNIIHENKVNAPDKGTNQVAIILHWANDTLIENNLFYDNVIAYRNKLGDYTWGNRNIFRYNVVRDCDRAVYMGGYIGASTDNRIEQNIFINTQAGVNVDLGNTRLHITNNVLYADPSFNPEGEPTNGIGYTGGTSPENSIYNNIIINYESPIGGYTDKLQPSLSYCDYNNYSSYVGFLIDWNWYTFDQFKSTVGGNNNVILNTDSLFVNPTNRDFHLQSSSPCIGTGQGGVDMGAYITGNETIGIDWTTPADTTPPAAPSGLAVS